jgi:hypothetical protein
MKTLSFIGLALLVALLAASAGPSSLLADDKPEKTLDVSEIGGTLVPPIADLFSSIEKVEAERKKPFDWASVVRVKAKVDYADPGALALNLGTRCAGAFLAIQARQPAKLKEILATIVDIGRKLGVDDPILEEAGALEALAAKEDERSRIALREKLIALQGTLEEYIEEEVGEGDMAVLVSAGGWLEGLRATCALLAKDYSEPASALLRQPGLAGHFEEEMEEIEDASGAVKQVAAKLGEIKALVNVEIGKPVPKESVEKLLKISTDLIDAVEKG